MQSVSPTLNISVIIATKDRYNDLLKCLESLNAQTYLPAEIIIVDSSSDEKIKDELKKKIDYKIPVKYLHSLPGLTLQRNIGIKAAEGDLIAFFDDDVVLSNDFFDQIISVFINDNERKIGGVTGRIINYPRREGILISLFKFLTFFSYPSYGEIRISGFHTEYNWYKYPLKVEWLMGAASIYRKDVFKQFSFDENLQGYAYNEDLDFSYRVSRKYECWYIPSAKLQHFKSSRRLSPQIGRLAVINNSYLLHKNILPDKSWAMRSLHLVTFYIAIFSFLLFLLIILKLRTLKGGIIGLVDLWFRKVDLNAGN